MRPFKREGKFERRFSDSSDRRRPSRSFGSRDSSRKPLDMHKVTCDKCGQSCEVPFKPTSGKPVYCTACFRKNESSESGKPNRYSSKPNENPQSDQPDKYKPEFEQINEKLNRILKILEEE